MMEGACGQQDRDMNAIAWSNGVRQDYDHGILGHGGSNVELFMCRT
jgi:hypothetical protein